jgi:hypothetical protein
MSARVSFRVLSTADKASARKKAPADVQESEWVPVVGSIVRIRRTNENTEMGRPGLGTKHVVRAVAELPDGMIQVHIGAHGTKVGGYLWTPSDLSPVN